MIDIPEAAFRNLVSRAIDEIPQEYAKHLQNVGFVVEDEPNAAQRAKLHLVNGVTLFGLYEGVPLPQRHSNYSGVLPDKITLFRGPLQRSAHDMESLYTQIKNTVWHEVAHHFGLGHGRIHELENR